MPNTTKTIELDAQTAGALASCAAGLGLSVAEFLRRHFGGISGVTDVNDVDGWLTELAEGLVNLSPLPRDFSTADLYTDHD